MASNDKKILKIVSNGTGEDTQVLLDGVPLPGVKMVRIGEITPSGLVKAIICVDSIALEMTINTDAKVVCNVCKTMMKYEEQGWVC